MRKCKSWPLNYETATSGQGVSLGTFMLALSDVKFNNEFDKLTRTWVDPCSLIGVILTPSEPLCLIWKVFPEKNIELLKLKMILNEHWSVVSSFF